MASLKRMSVADLRRELDRREKGAGKLQKQHAKLAKRLAEIDAELADMGVDVPKRRGRKPGRMPGRRGPGRPRGGRASKGGMTLMQAIEKGVPMGKTVSPAEAAEAAKRAGYKTSSKTFGVQVATALAKAGSFKKQGRGQYTRTGSSGERAKPGPKPGRGRKPGRRPGRKARRKPGRPKGSRNKAKAAAAKPEPAAAAS